MRAKGRRQEDTHGSIFLVLTLHSPSLSLSHAFSPLLLLACSLIRSIIRSYLEIWIHHSNEVLDLVPSPVEGLQQVPVPLLRQQSIVRDAHKAENSEGVPPPKKQVSSDNSERVLCEDEAMSESGERMGLGGGRATGFGRETHMISSQTATVEAKSSRWPAWRRSKVPPTQTLSMDV